MRRTLVMLLLLLACATVWGQNYIIEGRVININGRPIGFVPIYIAGTTNASITNEQGVYQLKVSPGNYTVIFGAIGYQQQSYEVTVIDHSVKLNLQLMPENYTLQSYLPQDDDPDSANVIMQQVIAHRQYYLKQLKAHSCQIYLKGNQHLLSAPKGFFKADVAKVLNLDADRKGIIGLFESISRFHVSAKGRGKEIMEGIKAAGGENPFGVNRASDMQINLYENMLYWNGLSTREYVSPVADFAMRYYRYQLLERFTNEDKTIDVIKVEPRRRYSQHVFEGIIYVVEGDWRLYGVDLSLYKHAQIDFVDTLNIREQFMPVNDSLWVPLAINFTFKGKILGFKYVGYYAGVANNYNFTPQYPPNFFNGEICLVNKQTTQRDSNYWNTNRSIALLPEEKHYYHLFDAASQGAKPPADSIKLSNNRFRLIPYVLKGYRYNDPFKKITVSVADPLKMVFYNTVEGWSADVRPEFYKGFTNNKSLTINPQVRYSSSAKVALTFNTEINYRYNPLRQSAIYGSLGSDYLDLNNSGTISLFLNSLSTLFTGNNYLKLYKASFANAGWQGEVCNGILLNGQVEYAYRETAQNASLHTVSGKDSTQLTSNNPLDPTSDVPLFPNHKAFSLRGSATFTFNQYYTINPDGKFIEPTKYPRMRINIRKGLGWFGSAVNYAFASVDFFQDQLKMGVLGYASYFVSAGKFFNRDNLYYPDYKQFRGGQSFFFDSSLGSFHFLNFYTYSTDKEYVEAHYEHNFNGFFLSRIPLIRRLNLDEIIGGSFLTQQLLPGYKEYYLGLKRNVIRFDYGFSYGRDLPVVQGFRIMYNL